MTTVNQHLIETIIKHLPPSASSPQVLDVNGMTGDLLSQLRPDVCIIPVSGDVSAWQFAQNQFDAVIAMEYILNDRFLRMVLPILRHGGRLIIANSRASMTLAQYGNRLETMGYVRILIEDIPLESSKGVLMRGEKAHITDDTHQRIQTVARNEAEFIPLSDYTGRFVHILIRQTPNKPPWRLSPDDIIQWDAVTINGMIIGFSSLPKAVSFMQPSVLMNKLYGVNKVAKFTRDRVHDWGRAVIINPPLTIWDDAQSGFISLNPYDAEAPDE
jgi:hypothetical protein